jgi:cation-transporting ATPase E
VIVQYAGYLLLLVIIFIVTRGILVNEPYVQIVNNIGALSSVLVPAGLVFATTLLFSYGAGHLFRRNVLLQEVNATEKLGRIVNLCMDKTGTLTENFLTVETMLTPTGVDEDFAKAMTWAYIQGTGESSQTFEAVKKYLGKANFEGKIKQVLNFSSWRRYGAVSLDNNNIGSTIFVGPADVFFNNVKSKQEKDWFNEIFKKNTDAGKHVLCVMSSPTEVALDNLAKTSLSIVAVFVFYNNLREGIGQTIDFFQKRGVHIRIISGDNSETVQSVAKLAGVLNYEKVITGKELEAWTETDFAELTKEFSIFAKILPEQKERIIEALKTAGFTAMVGDGANDALAIKKADLGIAMFDGSPATRQLASVVLVNNSFTVLPGGVELADSVIRNTELFASVYLNTSLAGLFFFLMISLLGYAFPLTALNMAFINYIGIAFPGILISLWVILPPLKAQPIEAGSFLTKILPFTIYSSLVQATGLIAIFALSPDAIKNSSSNALVLLIYIAISFTFFIFAPKVFIGSLAKSQKLHLFLLGLAELLIVFIFFNIPLLASFANISKIAISATNSIEIFAIICLSALAQYLLSKWFTRKNHA